MGDDDYEREFPNSEAKMTEDCNENKDKCGPPDQDSSAIMHGTKVASKALGQRHGVAKGANLVSIKIYDSLGDMLNGFGLIEDDMAKKKNQGSSVIMSSLGDTVLATDPSNMVFSLMLEQWFDTLIHEHGIPLVFAAGNERDESKSDDNAKRRNIDMLPGTLQSDEFPLR